MPDDFPNARSLSVALQYSEIWEQSTARETFCAFSFYFHPIKLVKVGVFGIEEGKQGRGSEYYWCHQHAHKESLRNNLALGPSVYIAPCVIKAQRLSLPSIVPGPYCALLRDVYLLRPLALKGL